MSQLLLDYSKGAQRHTQGVTAGLFPKVQFPSFLSSVLMKTAGSSLTDLYSSWQPTFDCLNFTSQKHRSLVPRMPQNTSGKR